MIRQRILLSSDGGGGGGGYSGSLAASATATQGAQVGGVTQTSDNSRGLQIPKWAAPIAIAGLFAVVIVFALRKN